MYGPTTTAHVAAKFAAALIGSVLALPASLSGNDSGFQQVAGTAVASIPPNRMEAATAGRAARPGESLKAPLVAKPATLRNRRDPAGLVANYRCDARNHCDPPADHDKRRLLVMFALWRALAP